MLLASPLLVACADGEASSWQAQCRPAMAQSVDAKVKELKAQVPSDYRGDWTVRSEFSAGEATVSIVPDQSIRGGGGVYRFSCADQTLELVEGYR
ncbi:hypothetical protein D1222_15235 [Henriciella algicola]|uniref:Uncharacterized protein n=2 Tax=Henriciella algicola TaxID=1608422 RepID=A0A399RD47_9PROT|nr:hypothetical protein D1222_15235 [Henriciella algicola]